MGGTIGLLLACNEDVGTKTKHCWETGGDATCAEMFGGERPYCTTDEQPCGNRADFGCVAQRPVLDECYSPCGNGQSMLDNVDCQGAADTGGMEGPETPDDYDNGPGCGNGRIDDGEECDDGNAADDDLCTTACTMAKCGDGIVQAAMGEVCDDGGTDPGDGCTVTCQLRGAAIADMTSDLLELGHTVAVDSQANITVLGTTFGASWLVKFGDDLEPRWDVPALSGSPASLALGADDQLLVGGMHDIRAHLQQISQDDGSELWMGGVADKPSSFSAVAAAEGQLVSVGYSGLPQKSGLLVRHDSVTGAVMTTLNWADGPLTRVAVAASGRVWAIGEGAAPELQFYAEDNSLDHTMALEPGVYEELIVDQEQNIYLLWRDPNDSSFTVVKLNAEGGQVWPPQTYTGAGARGLALLPGGTLVVAGYTTEQSTGLLAWFDQADGQLLDELEVGGEQAFAVFHDVAVAPDNQTAVAVGASGTAANSTSMWIYTFQI